MTSPNNGSEILKVDTLGRVRTSPQRREELLDEFERSGLSAAKFAAVVGIKYQTFANWVQQRRRQKKELSPVSRQSKDARVQWFQTVVQAAQPASTSSLVIRLNSGVQIEVSNAGQAALAAALLRAWEKLPC
jgi:transposase